MRRAIKKTCVIDVVLSKNDKPPNKIIFGINNFANVRYSNFFNGFIINFYNTGVKKYFKEKHDL